MQKKVLTIVIGGDMDKDDAALSSGKPLHKTTQTSDMLYLDSYDQLYRMLTPEKLDLLHYLMKTTINKKQKSVSQIADDLKRKQEAVSRDLHYLQSIKLIDLRKEGQKVLASTQLEAISIKAEE
ncbi:MAG TPA: hypothetical protein VJG83_06495 [archaeon]|nr:hypothetical protein [archaeon]